MAVLLLDPASIMVVAWAAPLIVSGPVTSRSPLTAVLSTPLRDNVYVPAGSVITSAPGAALAAIIASRSEQSSESQGSGFGSSYRVTTKSSETAGAAAMTKAIERPPRVI